MTNSEADGDDRRKNDDAWARFFASTPALDDVDTQGYSHITAAQLNKVTGREARLLAKLDTLHDRPSVFREHGLTIFPVKNGEYILFKDPDDKTYFRLGDDYLNLTPSQYESSVPLSAYEAFPPKQTLNESQALDLALLSSLLRTFTREHDLHLVIRGRTYTGHFQFKLPQVEHAVDVNGVQIEVDGGYESREAIYLLEAKTGRRTDFYIRQLYYPYLEWTVRSAARSRKRVVPIFFYNTNSKFYFFEFSFNEAFGDLDVQRVESYTINEPAVARIKLTEILRRTVSDGEPNIPFPQADDLDKVVDLLAFLDTEKDLERRSKSGIAERFEFAERQSNYYASAAVYLGLLKRLGKGAGFSLTPQGNLLVGTPSLVRRTELLIEQMAKRPVFRDALLLLQHRGMVLEHVSKAEIEAIIAKYTPLSDVTTERRSSTVRGWLRWLTRNAELI